VKIIVDTCIWSAALRSAKQGDSEVVEELRSLITDHRVRMIGPVRQEILSGIRDDSQFRGLSQRLASFPDLPILTEDYVTAAEYFNLCRGKGIQGSNTDFLICAVAVRNECAVFTEDGDFRRFAEHIPVVLHEAGSANRHMETER
jgi:predicted nucleic acid-binding protein